MNIKADTSDRDIYNFNSSGIGDSWIIGTDTTDAANAFKNGVDGCPVNLTIPSNLTDENGETKPVEVIGQYAFSECAFIGKTRRLTLTRQVKVIKYRGLGLMDDLIEFTLEDGSVLETIEQYGMETIGINAGFNEDSRVTLTLPSTISSVFEDGIMKCNLFNVIIYCGSHPLTNTSTLEFAVSNTSVKVSAQYPSNQTLFGRDPDRNSLDEVSEACSKMEDRPNFITVPVEGGCEVTGYGNNVSKWCPPNLNIPEVINESNVIAINESAFANCDTKGPISLPSTLQRVGASAFANTSFVTAVVANSLELVIGEAAFQGCGKEAKQPINVTLPENITLGNRAFAGAKIGEVNVLSIYA